MSTSPSEQSEGGVPLLSSPRTPPRWANDRLSIHGGDRKEEAGGYARSPFPNSEPEPRSYYGVRPPRPISDGEFLRSNFSSPDYACPAPIVAYNSTVLETIPAGSVAPPPAHPSTSRGYYSADNSKHGIEEMSKSIGNLNTTAHPDQQAAHFHVRIAHQRINGIIQGARRRADMPPQFAHQLEYELKETSQSLARVTLAIDKLSRHLEEKMVDCDRVQATAGLQAVEIERLRHDIDTARRETQSAETNSEELQKTYQDVLRSMEEQSKIDQEKIKMYEEQLNGKRHLFFAPASRDPREKTNGSNSTNRANTPTTGMTSVSHSSRMASPRIPFAVPPRPSSAFPGAGPRSSGSKPRSTPALRASYNNTGNGGHYKFEEPRPRYTSNELGSPVASGPSQALVAKASPEVEATIMHWQESFGKVFSMVHGWCSTYANQVKTDDAAQIQARAPRLWDYISDIIYPGRPESGASHAKYLLQEGSSRVYFVERLMLQYIINCMFAVEGWTEFREDVDSKLNALSQRLQSTELYKTFERQSIVDQIASHINIILMDPEFPSFRQRKENFHHQRLKTIVGPLMDSSASRSDAAYDLHNITVLVLQASANMFQSRQHIQFAWSNTCSKFSVESHAAKETVVDPVTLQMKQWRLKLVVTPLITLRDDRGLTAVPRRVLRSEVLVMN